MDYLTTSTGIVGAADNTSGFNVKASKSMPLAAGDEYVITFVNYNKGAEGTNYWANWSFMSNVFSCRADHGESNPYWGSATNVNYTGNSWSDIYSTIPQWLQAYNGVTVTLTVSRNAAGDGITISHTATTNAVDAIASQTYAGTFTATVGASEVINFYLTVENAHLKITKVDCNGTQFNFASSESAYVDATSDETKAANYNGASLNNVYINNTQYRDWGSSDGSVKVNANGKIAFYKFDLTAIKNKLTNDGGTITGVTFSVYGHSNDAGGPTNKVRVLGYNQDWSSSTITYNNMSNSVGTITGDVSATGTFQPLDDTGERSFAWAGTTLNENALTYVNSAIAADKDYVTFALTANYTRQGVLDTYANLSFTYSAAVLYEATFTETNSLNPTVTVYTDAGRTVEIAKNELEANTTYYFRAVLAGYETYEGSFNIETSNPVVNFTMTALPRYTFTVNAMNKANSATIQPLFTDDDSYEGKTYTVYFPAYLTTTGNVVTYSKDNSTFYTNYTSAPAEATKTVSYNAYVGDAWFFEGEDVTGATVYTTATFAGRSSNGKTGVLSEKAVTSLDAGVYRITARSIGKAGSTHSLYKESVSGEKIMDITTSTSGAIVSSVITLDATTDIVADGGYYTSSDNGHGFDYFLIEKNPTVPAAIGSTGYTTFASSYAMNLDGMTASTGTVKAYYVTASDVKSSSVALTDATGNVAAGTGLILEGTAGAAITIPVVAAGTALSGNKLVGCTTATDITKETANYANFYVLSATEAAFKKIKTWVDTPHTLTIPAGKAYLDTTGADVVGAPTLNFDLSGEATGIADVRGKMEDVRSDFFDLQGRKVAQPAKGLYIVNGKKVVIK